MPTCNTCGEPFPETWGGTQCTNCWEVETRLEKYLRSEKGRGIVHQMLNKTRPKQRVKIKRSD